MFCVHSASDLAPPGQRHGVGGDLLAKMSATAAPMKPKKGADAGQSSLDIAREESGVRDAQERRRDGLIGAHHFHSMGVVSSPVTSSAAAPHL